MERLDQIYDKGDLVGPWNGPGFFVSTGIKKGRIEIQSGSSSRGDAPFVMEAQRACCVASAGEKILLRVSAPTRGAFDTEQGFEASASLRRWLESYANALASQISKSFKADSAAAKFEISLHGARRGAHIDYVHLAPVKEETIRVEFVAPETWFSEFYRARTARVFAHETHHAYSGYLRAKKYGRITKRDRLAFVLNEVGAEIFGACVSMDSINYSDRTAENYLYDGRRGGVLPDSELAAAAAGNIRDDVSFGALAVFSDLIVNTLWTSVIGPDYLAEADRDSGGKLRELCAPESIETDEAVKALLVRFSSDGVDAPPFSENEGDVAKEGSRRLRGAIDRWRERNGLARRYEVEGVIGPDVLAGSDKSGTQPQ